MTRLLSGHDTIFTSISHFKEKWGFYSVLFVSTKRVSVLSFAFAIAIGSSQQYLIHTESIFIGFIKGERFLRQSELKIEVICEVIVNKTCE